MQPVRERTSPIEARLIPRSERLQRLSKEGLWIAAGQGAAVGGSIIGVRLLTSLLDPAEYGQLALGMTVATFVNQIVMGPLCNGATRLYAPAVEDGDLAGFFAAVRRLTAWASAGTLLLIPGAIVALVVMGESAWMSITIFAILFATLTGGNAVLSGVLNAARQRSIAAIHQGAESLGRSLVAAALLFWIGATSTIAMIGYAIVSLAVLASQYTWLRKQIPSGGPSSGHGRARWETEIWRFAWPFSTFGIFTWAQLVSDRWALQVFSSSQEVGRYAVLFQLGYYPIAIVSNMAMQLLAPIYYQRVGNAADEKRNASVSLLTLRLTNGVLVLTLVAFTITLLTHPAIFRIAAGREYASVSYLLPWLILSGGIFAAGQSLSLNLMSQMKSRSLVTAKIATAVFAIVLNLLGARLYGTAGVVGASVLFALSHLAWMEWLARSVTALPRA